MGRPFIIPTKRSGQESPKERARRLQRGSISRRQKHVAVSLPELTFMAEDEAPQDPRRTHRNRR
jgi:hypothetical protein